MRGLHKGLFRLSFLVRGRAVNRPISSSRTFSGVSRRVSALFFVLLLMFGTVQLTFTDILVGRAEAASRTPGALRNNKTQSYNPEGGASGKPIEGQEVPLVNDPSTYKPPAALKEEEVVSERSADRTVTRKSDGSYEAKVFFDAVNYKKDGRWQEIDKTLIEDKNAVDSSNILGRLWGNARSAFTEESTYKVKANDWQARFAPTSDKVGMLRYQKDIFDISFKPVNARPGIKPVIVHEDGVQKVKYSDVWSGVDLEYEVTGSKIKEFIIIKNAGAETQISFDIAGAELEEDKDNPGGFKIKGLEGINIAPLSVSLTNFGPWTDSVVATQSYSDSKLSVSIDKSWLKNLTGDKFPVVIDPTVQNSGVGLTYIPYKSDGFVGSSSNLWMNAGTSLDNYKKWRTAFRADYSFLQGKTLLGAGLYLSRTTYTTESLYYEVSHANCLCYGGINWGAPRTSAWFGQDAWIDVYPQYKWLTDNGDYGSWLMLNGEERNHYTLKGFRDNAYVSFTYTTKPPITTPAHPVDKQVMVTDQPTLRVNTIAPSDNDQIKYYFRVATNSNAESGTIFNSGWIDSPTWTLPESALQDNMTYYWHVYSSKWNGTTYYTQTNPDWVRSFKVDLRNGKDTTQSYDTAGPVSVNLATGNATTSASTHSMAALGGNIGMGVEYNTPYASKPGVLAEYFNNTTFAGTPAVTRVESNINNLWDLGSPSAGVVPVDGFSARYTGYFVAPKTGSYYFGGVHDDSYKVYVDDGLVYSAPTWTPAPAKYGSAVSLQEGQVAKIKVEMTETGGPGNAQLWVKGAVLEQIVPTEMLRTAPRLVSNNQGLNANYYYDSGNHVFPSSATSAFASRRESKISFNWGGGSPVPTGPTDSWMASYDGYVTVPTTGTYQFGANNDDAVRIWINGQLVMDQWANDSNVGSQWGSSIYLVGGKAAQIRVEFYEKTGSAQLYLNVRGAVTEQEVPSSWLSVKAPLLPNGWNISLDADGSLKYDYAVIRPSSVLLVNADGSTYDYTWTGSGYKPPVNEYGTLVKNQDGTLTLQDADGMTYVFAADGTLKSTTSPGDDRKPTSLQFEYSSSPTRLTRIIDPVDPSRFGTVRYKGDSACPSAPSGFDAEAPSNMICSFDTTDGNTTKFFYKNGQLARIEQPGEDITDIGYDSLGRIVQQRSSLANDVIKAGLRANDAGVTTEITYDALGRVSKVTEPAPNAGDIRREHTYAYRIDARVTEMRIANTSEPNGYSSKVEYDALYRAVKVYDKAGLVTQTEWDPVKDLSLSVTDPTGLKTTTIYNADDLPIDGYGPAPSAWFGTDRKPLAAHAAQVPRTETKYDEGMVGPAVAWYNAKGSSLFGSPKLHTSGFGHDGSSIHQGRDFRSNAAPITPDAGMDGYGFSATGKLRAPGTGTYTFRVWHDDGLRLWVDDKLVIDNWNYRSEGIAQTSPIGTFVAEAGKTYRYRLDYIHFGAAGGLEAWIAGPGISDTNPGSGLGTSRPNFVSPGYNLATSTKVYDSQIGDVTNVTNYGTKPELGQVVSMTGDVGGLNLTTGFAYEPYQTGSLLRQTGKTLPGGNTFNYNYYGATETRDNPCTAETESYKQAGFIKQKTEPDPDGTGSQASRTSETIYDDTGRTVASRLNNDPWTCSTYDARGRVIKTDVPDINGRPGRTVTTDYSYEGSPLKVRVLDSVAGATVSEVDLLGRATSAADTFGNVSTATYDNQGRLISKTSPLGTESYTYDNYDRVTAYKVDDVTYATVTYDTYSRVQDITYDQAKDDSDNKLKLEQIKRDALQRNSGAVFRFSNDTAFDETVTLSQTGRVIAYTDAFGGSSATSTYAYDKAGRLTAANIDGNAYSYGYGAPTGCAGTYNANAHKNSNRTTFTANGATTTYCYDHADRLISSSDAQLGTPTYDDHGNTVSLAGGGTPITFTYDASDSNIAIQQGDYKVEYVKTASGSVLRKKEYQSSTLTKSYRYLAGGAVLQTCDLADDNNCATTDAYIGLPGGTTLTLSPANPDESKRTTYSIKNFHGDTSITAGADGTPTSSIFLYEPFGQAAPSATFGTNSNPENATDQSMGWAANPTRKVAGTFTLPIIQMGARLYLPTAGRFLQVDPVEGGTLNAYVYAHDPVNLEDYSGQFISSLLLFSSAVKKVASVVVKAVTTVAKKSGGATAPASQSGRAAPQAKPVAAPKSATVNGYSITDIARAPRDAWMAGPNGANVRPGRPTLLDAANSANGWANGGALAGGLVGCVAGAIPGTFAGAAVGGVGAVPGAGAGCVMGGAGGARIGTAAGAALGWLLGIEGHPWGGAFDGMPDTLITPW